jgi:hypothetical protein
MTQDQPEPAPPLTEKEQDTADLIQQLRQSEATLAQLLHPNSSN